MTDKERHDILEENHFEFPLGALRGLPEEDLDRLCLFLGKYHLNMADMFMLLWETRDWSAVDDDPGIGEMAPDAPGEAAVVKHIFDEYGGFSSNLPYVEWIMPLMYERYADDEPVWKQIIRKAGSV